MPAFLAPLAISGISALAGLLGNRKKQQQQRSHRTGTNTQTQQFNQTSTTMPTLDPLQSTLRDTLFRGYMRNLNYDRAAPNIVDAGLAEGVQNVNRGANAQRKILMNAFAARGLKGPQAAAVRSGIESERIGNVTRILNQRGALIDSLMRQRLGEASQFLASLPTGQTTTSSGSSTGTTNIDETTEGTLTDPGNPTAGFFGNMAGALAGFYGAGAFGGPTAVSPVSIGPGRFNFGFNDDNLSAAVQRAIATGRP